MQNYPELEVKELPEAPRASKAIGVGVVVMGLAIGTGELILWPHLTVKYGLGILWFALLGILFQAIINHEVARHEVATGESFFTSSGRYLKWSPVFWLFSAFLLYLWPGWASVLGSMLASLFGFGTYLIWGWVALALVLVCTFTGKVAYDVLEWSLKIIVPIFFILIVFFSVLNISTETFVGALKGLVNFGYIPQGIDMQVLLGAVVFAGAGGMLNLCISLWYRDKNFGMGAHTGRISNPITGKAEAVSPMGAVFDVKDEKNLFRWHEWMKFVKIDQGVIFFGLGFTTLFLLSVNAYSVLAPLGIVPEGLNVATAQAEIFSAKWGIWGEKLFLVMASFMLFSVMWTVLDALARIVSDILHTNSRMGELRKYFSWLERISVHHMYYATILIVVVLGAALLPLKQPLPWITLSGALGGVTMAIYTPMLIYLNNKKLAKTLRPNLLTNVLLVLISAFFIYFSFVMLAQVYNSL